MILSRLNNKKACQKKIESTPAVPPEESLSVSQEKTAVDQPEQAERDLLDCTLELAPFIKGLLGEEVGIYVSDLERYIYCDPGRVGLSLKAGDIVKEGSVTALALRTGQRQVTRVGKEVYGIPYIGISCPITDAKTGKIVGALSMTTPITRQENLVAASKEMENQVNTITMAITNLSATAEELAATTENLNSNAQNIRNEIKKTDNIVALIQEIAEQTHLLGLNAAIEAARVGDAGRGFNVVAGEIRKLSQDTQRSVKEIMQTLHDMQQSIMELTHSVEQMSAAAQQQAASSQEINAAVNELGAVAAQLKKLADELVV
ncbi:methyl-accepting chemotaxis protein [Desulfofundulus salinus]|uniref:Chemotaxis protein n=1 Tax=Desulfofundulus salinus TaxID=2419843 RepID=A0A494WUF5_9FIRM|nr:methyl-accepting chemotaxis protein [Desulfofundulus salinum]RKO67049.1 chemotaxis protein [Desulfofundulus salinum]